MYWRAFPTLLQCCFTSRQPKKENSQRVWHWPNVECVEENFSIYLLPSCAADFRNTTSIRIGVYLSLKLTRSVKTIDFVLRTQVTSTVGSACCVWEVHDGFRLSCFIRGFNKQVIVIWWRQVPCATRDCSPNSTVSRYCEQGHYTAAC